MKLEQQTHHRWEKERESLREQIAAMEDGRAASRFDGIDTRKNTTDTTLETARAELAEVERLLEKYDHWRD